MTMGLNNSLHKQERLRSRKLIGALFGDGKHFFHYPFKVIWHEVDATSEYPVQVLISVSKRNFRKAVSRNRLKRMIREAYRQHKSGLIDTHRHKGGLLLVGLIFTGDTIPEYKEIERKIILILHRLTEQDAQAAG